MLGGPPVDSAAFAWSTTARALRSDKAHDQGLRDSHVAPMIFPKLSINDFKEVDD